MAGLRMEHVKIEMSITNRQFIDNLSHSIIYADLENCRITEINS